ncbi:F0F1 ATP synthase subunit epsilon [Actinomycetospora cinnamomea]|uniref:ATP synthase epsilon chain n=1 Tax=Actinomycetospora cinnamomea TaxID=663609 RepID=A0A2U1FRN8_9PSEU|nr:F0F1 ATP synthase subunit epsilon [Actinomycetospora cinnamomea]PVZ14730.1 ATP synthase F1 subcomplex epsilon subunit [Actinomycetospora cinnamomea]
MAEMEVAIVGVEKRLWSGQANFVSARTVEGDIGLLPGHQPVIAALDEAGVVRIDPTDGESFHAAVFGGFLSVTAESVTILAEQAEIASEIDVSAARDELQRAEGGNEDDHESRAAAARARARLRAAGENPDR